MWPAWSQKRVSWQSPRLLTGDVCFEQYMSSVISSLSVWGPDLWLGLECLFNEQLLCPHRVSFTNEWVTVSLSFCLCLFIISQIHSIRLSRLKTGPLSQPGQGSSLDGLGCLPGTFLLWLVSWLQIRQPGCYSWKKSNETGAGLPQSVIISLRKHCGVSALLRKV